jgi:thermopsin
MSPRFLRAGRWTLVPLLSVCLLLSSAPVAAGLRVQNTNLPYFATIPNGYFEDFPIGTVSSSSTISLVVSSNTPLSTALMTSAQFTSFNNSETDLSDSLYLVNASSAQDTLSEPIGTYYLVFYAYGRTANVYFNLESNPIDPYYYIPFLPPEPTGVASFGLYNASGNAVPYQVETSEIVGVGDISSMQAYNASASFYQSNISGATLQLNTVLVVNESDGAQQSYWIQNTPDFVTSASMVAFGDNIWNFSVSGILSNSSVTSSVGGAVYSFPDDGSTGYYYSYEGDNITYSFPLGMALLVQESVEPGVGVVVGLGAQLFQNGGGPVTPVEWFDNATISDPLVQSAYFFVSGSQTTPDGLYYDTELVFAGENNGEATDFTQMSSSLGLFFENATTSALQSFPSLFTFGGDTSEAADNLQVTYSGNGFAQVSTGTPDYVYLGPASGTISFPLSALNTTTTTASSQSSAASSATQTVTSTTTSQSSSSTSSSTSIAISPWYAAVALVTASAVALMLGLSSRARVKRVSSIVR